MKSTDQIRVVDPILTNHARGYSHPERVGHLLFPAVPVPLRAGKRLQFGKESFKLYNSKRAPGAKRQEIQFGYEGNPYSLEQSSLAGKVPREHVQEAERGPGINLQRGAINLVMNSIDLEKEVDRATKAQNAATYDGNHKVALAGADRWNDADSKPKDDIKAGKEAVRSTAGRYPNTLIIGPKVFSALDDHPTILEKFKYTSSDSITTEMLAKYFDIERVAVGKAVYADDDDEFVDVWGKNAVLAWVPPQASNWGEPSYGYTYQLDGMPLVEEGYWDKDTSSWKYPYTDEWSAELVGAEAGFLIQTAVD